VVSVDVKSQVQALDRTQPMLPVDFGKTAKRTHDYVRNGTVDLYACQDVRTGKVTANLSATHTTQDFLKLMDMVLRERSEEKVHVVLDNASAHKSGEAKKWLAKHEGRVVFHFTPTGASWLNMIEIWNGVITRQLIRRGTSATHPMFWRVSLHPGYHVRHASTDGADLGVPAAAPAAILLADSATAKLQ